MGGFQLPSSGLKEKNVCQIEFYGPAKSHDTFATQEHTNILFKWASLHIQEIQNKNKDVASSKP